MKVVPYVVSSVVRFLVVVTLVSFKLVGVHKVVHELEHSILEADYRLTLRVEVEWHVVVTFDVHKVVVCVQQGES